ncbi:MAG: transposase [Pseudomonadota bacterium]
MLGRRSAQSGLFDTGNLLGAEQVRKIPFYGHLAATWREIFRDEDFAELYADVGRGSVPPSILATATVLQRFENISDAEVVERTKYDLRWKAVFDTNPCSLVPLFAKSSLQLFRLRLVLNEKQGLLFDAVLAEARRRGLLPKQLQVALDSSPVRGRGAVKDAFNLLSDAIGRVVRAVAKECSDPCRRQRPRCSSSRRCLSCCSSSRPPLRTLRRRAFGLTRPPTFKRRGRRIAAVLVALSRLSPPTRHGRLLQQLRRSLDPGHCLRPLPCLSSHGGVF